MDQFLLSVVVPCMVFLSFSLEAGDFRGRIQSFCDEIEKVGQSWVDTIVYCDCSEQCPAVSISSIKQDCPSVFAADWRTNVDHKKVPEAQAMLALAQLSSACCNFLGHANITHGT